MKRYTKAHVTILQGPFHQRRNVTLLFFLSKHSSQRAHVNRQTSVCWNTTRYQQQLTVPRYSFLYCTKERGGQQNGHGSTGGGGCSCRGSHSGRPAHTLHHTHNPLTNVWSRQAARTRSRRQDTIKTDIRDIGLENVDCIHVTRDTGLWQVPLTKTVIRLCGKWRAGHVFTTCAYYLLDSAPWS
jgi:hypothetical protein